MSRFLEAQSAHAADSHHPEQVLMDGDPVLLNHGARGRLRIHRESPAAVDYVRQRIAIFPFGNRAASNAYPLCHLFLPLIAQVAQVGGKILPRIIHIFHLLLRYRLLSRQPTDVYRMC